MEKCYRHQPCECSALRAGVDLVQVMRNKVPWELLLPITRAGVSAGGKARWHRAGGAALARFVSACGLQGIGVAAFAMRSSQSVPSLTLLA